jgi:CxxC motif-containing protein (DUF1111 family)
MTPAGMVLNGQIDEIENAPGEEGDLGTVNQRSALVDFLEFYLLNYFKPGIGEQTLEVRNGRKLFQQIGCASCLTEVILRHGRGADVARRVCLTRFREPRADPRLSRIARRLSAGRHGLKPASR